MKASLSWAAVNDFCDRICTKSKAEGSLATLRSKSKNFRVKNFNYKT